MRCDLATLCRGLGLTPPQALAERTVAGVATDSRGEVTGRLFFALTGPRFDGHDFVAQALAKGASAAVVAASRWATHPDAVYVPGDRILAVTDPLTALGTLAHWWRQQWGGPVVAITGSAGKTTTKELLAAAFRAALGDGAVWATPGNWNNAVGVPLTLLGLTAAHQVAVVEVAMNQPGEIAALGRLVAPNVAVVLNALRAHLAGLGSVAAIAAEKGALVTTLAPYGVAVLPIDSPFFDHWQQLAAGQRVVTFGRSQAATVRVLATRTTASGLTVTVDRAGQPFAVTLPRWGEHLGALVAAALAVLDQWPFPLGRIDASAIGHSAYLWEAAAAAWAKLPPVPGRLQRLVTPTGAILFDDTYNANPDAMRAAIDVLVAEAAAQRIVVIGEMAELGAASCDLHKEVGAYARDRGIDRFYALGGDNARAAAAAFGRKGRAYENAEALLAELLPEIDDQTAILVKGSRVSRMEQIVAALFGQGGKGAA